MGYSSDELRQEAYTRVKKMIVTKKLIPGETILQERLCDMLGISIASLNEALEMLATESILVHSSLGRMKVRELSTTEILEIFDCRIALETKAIELFTRFASQERIDDLRNLLVPFEKGNCSATVFLKIDMHFHYLIIKNCGNQKLYDVYEQGNFLACMELIGLIEMPQKEILQDHLNIVSAIHQRDVDRAVVLMKRHIEKSKDAFYSQ